VPGLDEAMKWAARIPISELGWVADQDHRLWDTKTVIRAESLLAESASFRRIGRFQLEAAIQSAHMQRLFGRQTPWREILGLYEALAATTPAIGVLVSQAAALHQANRAREALETLDRLDPLIVHCYQPYWAVRAFVLASLGYGDASQCFMKAIGLCTDSPARDYLRK
jgi:predicted RNA polymerase sigma factor